jgi:hypothetical protein
MDQVPAQTRLGSRAASATVTTAEPLEEWIDARATAQARRAANARQVSGRRRFVDPTTCERDYSREEIEFMQAMEQYKKDSGRMFPTWCEVLEVMLKIGYRKDKPIGESVVTTQSTPARAASPKR